MTTNVQRKSTRHRLNAALEVDRETVELTERTYLALRSRRIDKAASQELENLLAISILRAEEGIHRHKRSGSDSTLENLYRTRRAILKRVADGLAWRFLGHDEHALRTYARSDAPGFMAQKLGHTAERRTVEAAYGIDQIKFAIQNDITNILRVADITLVLSDGTAQLLEIKSTLRQKKRQWQRYDVIQDYLRSGIASDAKTFGHDTPLQTLEIPGQQNNCYWTELERLALKAIRDGSSWKEVDDGVLVLCHKSGFLGHEGKFASLLARAFDDAEWERPSIRHASLNKHFDSMEKSLLRFTVPITVFDMEPAVVLQIAADELVVHVVVNLNVVVQQFERSGFQASFSDNCDDLRIMSRSRTKLVQDLRVPELFWIDLLYGLRTLPSLVDQCVTVFQMADEGALKEQGR